MADTLEIGDAGAAFIAGGFDLGGVGFVTNRGVIEAGGPVLFPQDLVLAENALLVAPSNGVTWTFGGNLHNYSAHPGMDMLGARVAFTASAEHEFATQAPDLSNSLAGFSGRGGVGALVVDGVVEVLGALYVWSLEGAGELVVGAGSKVYYVSDAAWSGEATVDKNGVFEQIPFALTNIVRTGSDVTLHWPGAAGLNFAVEWGSSADAGDFTVATNFAAAGTDVAWQDGGATNRPPPAAAGYRTYRIKAYP